MNRLHNIVASLVTGPVPPVLFCPDRLAWQVLPGSHCQSAVFPEGCLSVGSSVSLIQVVLLRRLSGTIS